MFTGLINSVGTILYKEMHGPDMRLQLDAGHMDMSEVKLGDSIAVNGVCLTVTKLLKNCFHVDVSKETLQRTTLNELNIYSPVNLEQALLPTTRLGGHFVSGHVDTVAVIQNMNTVGDCAIMETSVPEPYLKFVAEKGSICIDGVSLTVNTIRGSIFAVNIVPHTLQNTIFGKYTVGRRVNLEVDLIARYLERLSEHKHDDVESNGLNREFLRTHGYLQK